MEGNILGIHAYRTVNRIAKALICIVRQTCDKIHVYIVKAEFSRFIENTNIVNGVPSANGFENIIVKGLRIYAYSADSHRFDDSELFGGYRVGSAGFDRVFS